MSGVTSGVHRSRGRNRLNSLYFIRGLRLALLTGLAGCLIPQSVDPIDTRAHIPPRIQVDNQFLGLYLLSWPGEASRFILHSSTVLPGSAADWTDVADVFVMGDRYAYGLETDPAPGRPVRNFFRLVRR